MTEKLRKHLEAMEKIDPGYAKWWQQVSQEEDLVSTFIER